MIHARGESPQPVGVDSAKAARKRGRGSHKYSRSKFSSVGEASGAVLAQAFGSPPDAA